MTDADDFLFATQELFDFYKNKYVRRIARQNPGLPVRELRAELETVNRNIHHKVGVRPTRWFVVADELAKLHRHEMKLRRSITDPANIGIFATLYRSTPQLLPGALTTVRALYHTGLPLIMVTNANVEWTYIKLRKSRILKYFTHIEIISENVPTKNHFDWERAATHSGIKPRRSLAMGDSLSSDIQPAAVAKYRILIWAPREWSNSLSSGDIPKKTIQISGVKEVISTLTSLSDV